MVAAACHVVKADVLTGRVVVPPMNTHTFSLCYHSKQSMFSRHRHDGDVMIVVVVVVMVVVAIVAVATNL